MWVTVVGSAGDSSIGDCRKLEGARPSLLGPRTRAAAVPQPLGAIEGPLHRERQHRCGHGAGQHLAVSLTASPATMRSPRPPAPMKAATVAVPTLMTAAVCTPASSVGSASGSCTRRSACPARQAQRARRRRAGPRARRAGRRACCARWAAARRGTAPSAPARNRCAPSSTIRKASSASEGTVCSTPTAPSTSLRQARPAPGAARPAARRPPAASTSEPNTSARCCRSRRPRSGAKSRSIEAWPCAGGTAAGERVEEGARDLGEGRPVEFDRAHSARSSRPRRCALPAPRAGCSSTAGAHQQHRVVARKEAAVVPQHAQAQRADLGVGASRRRSRPPARRQRLVGQAVVQRRRRRPNGRA